MVVEQVASATPIETRVAPDGVGYTWAEFESYCDDDIAAAIWEAAEIVAAPEPTRSLRTRHLASIPCMLRECKRMAWFRLLVLLTLFVSLFVVLKLLTLKRCK